MSSGLLIYYLPVPKFTVEDKAYSVGYEEIHIVVEGRAQPKAFYELSNLDSLGTRELLVDIYYPSSSETKPVQLFKNASSQWGVTVINYLNRTWGINLPTFLFSHLNLSYFDVGNDLSKLTNKSPVLIYTHGWAGEKIFANLVIITCNLKRSVLYALLIISAAAFETSYGYIGLKS